MPELPDNLEKLPWGDIVASIIIVIAAFIARWVIVRMIKRDKETLTSEQRKWISTTQNSTLLFIVIGLLAVWSLELSRVALSLAAFGVAIVIAGKELILCVTGGLYRAGVKPFEVGDWIEVGNFRGEVLREGMLTTHIQELAPDGDFSHTYTGRDMTVPNALLLTHPVIDLNFNKRFVFHIFEITLPEDAIDPDQDFETVRNIVDEEWQKHQGAAEQYWSHVRRRSGIDLGQPEPQVNLETTELCHIRIRICIFCPRNTATSNETNVTRRILSHVRSKKHAEQIEQKDPA